MILKIQKLIEQYIINNRFCLSQCPDTLFEPIDYTLSVGGKRIRPLLCLLSASLYSDKWESILPQAFALEVFHNFTLLHDDLMDKSALRRGKTTVYRKWNDNIAILSGDAMSILAYNYLCRIEQKDKLQEVLRVFSNTALDVCKGQQYDMDFEVRKDVTLDEYMEMIRLKTAVLLGASLQIGALSVGVEWGISQDLYHIGIDMGLAFQIQDDILDVYGCENTLGKPIGNDIRNAKKTLLLLYTRDHLSDEDRIYLDQLLCLSEVQDKTRIEGVMQLYQKVDVKTYAEGRVAYYTQRAFDKLNKLQVSNEKKAPMVMLFNKLLYRES